MNEAIDELTQTEKLLASYMAVQCSLEKLTEESMASYGITRQQLMLLRACCPRHGVPFKQLIGEGDEKQQKVNIKVLIERGLAKRQFEDKQEMLYLTDKGEKLINESIENAFTVKALLKVVRALSQEELDVILAFNQHVAEELKK